MACAGVVCACVMLPRRQDFALLGLDSSLVTVYHRDVCGLGFPTVGSGGLVDAIFLDLPQPSAAPLVASVCRNLRPNGRLCSFSPCIEQVQRMCVAMAQNGFQGSHLH